MSAARTCHSRGTFDRRTLPALDYVHHLVAIGVPAEAHAAEKVQVVAATEDARLVTEEIDRVGNRLSALDIDDFQRERVVAVVDQVELLAESRLAVGQEAADDAVVGVVYFTSRMPSGELTWNGSEPAACRAPRKGRSCWVLTAAHCSTHGPAVT